MIDIFGVVGRLVSRIRASRQSQVRLAELRAENPTCEILSVFAGDVQLGEYGAILNGVCLKQVSLGKFSYVSDNSHLVNVAVGSFCSIGPDVRIGFAQHPSRTFVSTYPAFYSNHNGGCPKSFRRDKVFDDSVPKTTIGNDVWIGAHVIIPGGIQINTGAIVAAGSVIVKDVPPYAIVGGNPATVIRHRFSDEQIKVLLESEWWNWSIDKIRTNAEWFVDIEKFKSMVNEPIGKLQPD